MKVKIAFINGKERKYVEANLTRVRGTSNCAICPKCKRVIYNLFDDYYTCMCCGLLKNRPYAG